MTVVSITQPSIYPWVGQFEKLARSDVHVVLDDATFQKAGYLHRLILKSPAGPRWLTIPLASRSSNQRISDVTVSPNWAGPDALLGRARAWYSDALHLETMLDLLRDGLEDARAHGLVEAAERSITRTGDALDLSMPSFVRASQLGVSAEDPSSRLAAIVRAVGGTTYLFGRGRTKPEDHYLRCEPFTRVGVALAVMDYVIARYPQLHGPFAARLSLLDAVAMLGTGSVELLGSSESVVAGGTARSSASEVER